MKNWLKSYLRFNGMCAVKIFICALIGTVLLTLVYMIPTEKIDENIRKSVDDFYFTAGNHSVFSWCHSELDDFTDAWILMETAYSDTENSLKSAMEVSNGLTKDYDVFKLSVLYKHYIEDEALVKTISYERYWHGILVLTKIIFCFTDYFGLRVINMVVQYGVMATICILLVKKNLKYYLIPYLLTVLSFVPTTLVLSIQYSTCYYILNIGLIVILITSRKSSPKVFLYMGIALAYFDFLTYPITVLGIPGTLFFVMNQKYSLRKELEDMIKIFYCWGIGYGGMWFSKWLIASIVLRRNIFQQAFTSMALRTSSTDSEHSINLKETFLRNINNFKDTPFRYFLVLFILSMLVFIAFRFLINRHRISVLRIVGIVVPFVIISLLPFFWYAITLNHSFIHAFFTNKALTVTVFAITCMLVKVCFFDNTEHKVVTVE